MVNSSIRVNLTSITPSPQKKIKKKIEDSRVEVEVSFL
jgi:hypothetical protein